jgi:hypothetical protein
VPISAGILATQGRVDYHACEAISRLGCLSELSALNVHGRDGAALRLLKHVKLVRFEFSSALGCLTQRGAADHVAQSNLEGARGILGTASGSYGSDV